MFVHHDLLFLHHRRVKLSESHQCGARVSPLKSGAGGALNNSTKSGALGTENLESSE